MKKYVKYYDWALSAYRRTKKLPRKMKKRERSKTLDLLKKEVEFDKKVGIPFVED